MIDAKSAPYGVLLLLGDGAHALKPSRRPA
jgi:hypothetical protein